jgi:hypothetical protein
MDGFIRGMGIGLVILFVLFTFADCIGASTPVDEKIFIVECEITQLDFAVKQSVTRYIMGFRSENGFSGVAPITAEQYAWYSIGDTVQIEVTQKTYRDGSIENSCKIITNNETKKG